MMHIWNSQSTITPWLLPGLDEEEGKLNCRRLDESKEGITITLLVPKWQLMHDHGCEKGGGKDMQKPLGVGTLPILLASNDTPTARYWVVSTTEI